MRTGKIIKCECGAKLDVKVCQFLNVGAQRELEEELIRVELNAAKCQNCGKVKYIDEPFIYYNADRKIKIRVLPPSWRREPRGESLSDSGFWTWTFYGIGALINFIVAERNVPRKYRDLVAEQAQMIEDEHRAISESRCSCGQTFKVERPVVRSSEQVPIEIVKARCTGCGRMRGFFFPYMRGYDKRGLEAPVPVSV
ncbi:MAG: CpXC domain-containing protein [Thermoproteota archaeon]